MSNNLISVNNLSVGNNLTVNQNILGSGSIQMTGSIQGSNITATGNISGSNINFTGNLNNLTQQNLLFLDATSSIQTQLNTNTTNISSNTSNIAKNTTNIASTTANIASNTANIASNTTSINTLNTIVTNTLSSFNATNQVLAGMIATNTTNITQLQADDTLKKADLFTFELSMAGDSVIRYCIYSNVTSHGILKIVSTSGTPFSGLSFFNLGVHRININFTEHSLNGVVGDVYTLDITCFHLNSNTNLTKCLGMVGTGWCQNFAPGVWNTSGFLNNQIQYLSIPIGPVGGGFAYPNSGAFSFLINNTVLTDVWVIGARQNQIGILSSMFNCSVEFVG